MAIATHDSMKNHHGELALPPCSCYRGKGFHLKKESILKLDQSDKFVTNYNMFLQNQGCFL